MVTFEAAIRWLRRVRNREQQIIQPFQCPQWLPAFWKPAQQGLCHSAALNCSRSVDSNGRQQPKSLKESRLILENF